ncbi:hypothetical protein TPEGhana051_0126b [Treponema pallidum subsp. pertenue]|uniref:Uncharacterized protein n=3 Tax=Treponema pallidum TaxID=160 RepID=E5FNT1_TREPE|nr:hypothetical protein [Treponema pallidum subsp. pertenue]ADR64351.1 hypothetical protein [Treponema pallidum subsp. pertenue str. Gauthier]AEZ57247.1 hypothetical protein TPESAMD_0126b [Treponema pallidum subsp. pertenue str. SamoaD]AEZ58316.1 hypothetical protein TPECDC2_0126b [Treponema pallidum subsp. pertenue str. CDC2]ADR64332.1 hypothetical protein [Treponema pallidum subsp. pertenue]
MLHFVPGAAGGSKWLGVGLAQMKKENTPLLAVPGARGGFFLLGRRPCLTCPPRQGGIASFARGFPCLRFPALPSSDAMPRVPALTVPLTFAAFSFLCPTSDCAVVLQHVIGEKYSPEYTRTVVTDRTLVRRRVGV